MRVALIGVAGSGKTTLGQALAARLGWPFLDADVLHTPASVTQMQSGTPLTDRQRDAWFDRVVAAVAGRDPLVLACSALRRPHRDRMRALGDLRLILLRVPAAELRRRLESRAGHFFDPRLLVSQLEAFDPPAIDEEILEIDATGPAGDVLARLQAAASA
ncbi:MAG: gluconokinase, GntK/IdnK-type [Solirubrobacterales bacterium]